MDKTMDVTDAWNELFDPENKLGAIVTAELRIKDRVERAVVDPEDRRVDYANVYEVVRLRIETEKGVTFTSRFACAARGMRAALRRIERIAAEEDENG